MSLAAVIVPLAGYLLLAAHAMRPGNLGLALSLVLIGLLALTRQAFVRPVLSIGLAAGSLAWVLAGRDFILMRLAMGQPWLRLALIMAAIIALTLAGAVLLLGPPGRRRFHKNPDLAVPLAATGLLTLATLYFLQYKLDRPILLAERYAATMGWLEATLIALYAVFICFRLLDPKLQAATRSRIWRLFSLVFFGQLVLGLLGATHMLMTGALHLPVPALIVSGPIFRGGGLFMLWLFLASVAILGPAWCSHLCYIGAWDDVASRSKKVPAPLPAWTVKARAALLAAAVLLPIALRLAGTPTLTAVWCGAAFGLAGLAVMLLASTRNGTMTHCAAFCPLGLAANLLGKLTPWRVKIAPNCTGCHACLPRCRYNALTPERLAQGKPGLSCTLCGDCVSACKHDALHVRFAALTPSQSRTLFVTLAAWLHAVFLAVARI